jgi:hypothetical protein
LAIVVALVAAPAMASTISDTTFLTGTQVNVNYTGVTSYASSQYYFTYGNLANLTDYQVSLNDNDSGPFYLDTDSDGRIGITGFNSAFNDIRIFTATGDSGHCPGLYAIAVRCSANTQTSTSAILAASYETSLGTIPKTSTYTYYDTGASATGRGYYDFACSAPAGTQSVFFDLGATSTFVRFYEIELITTSAPVPEPGTLALLAAGLAGLLCYAWRKRRQM